MAIQKKTGKEGTYYRPKCESCGWVGERQYDKAGAEYSLNRHEAAQHGGKPNTGQSFVKVQKKEAAVSGKMSQVVKIVNGKRTIIERNLAPNEATNYAMARNKQAKPGTIYRAESMYK